MPSLKDMAYKAAGYASPHIGSAIGNYFGGTTGAGIGNAAGNLFGNYLTGNQNPEATQQGMGYLNQFGQGITDTGMQGMNSALGKYLSPELQNTAMNTKFSQMGPTIGSQYGQQLAKQYSPGFMSPAAEWLGGKIGGGIGHAGQSIANKMMPNYMANSTPTQFAQSAGNYAKNTAFTSMPQSFQNAARIEDPAFATKYARGGYAMGGGIQNSAPINISNPYMNYGAMQANNMGSMNPVASYAMGGYAGTDQPYEQNNEYGLNSLNEYGLGAPRYRPSLREYSDMMPMG
jgi:hypothetical protein